jgi:stage V sporulation protein D (sporulation-specific penicillin-binding protein)
MFQFAPKNIKNGSRGNTSGKEGGNHFRIYALFFFFFFIAGGIVLRLYTIQVSAFDYYKELANNQHFIFKNLVPQRGEIYLKEGDDLYPVAVNKETKMAYAVPREIENPKEVVGPLSSALGLDEKEIEFKIGKPEDMYEILKHKLSDEEIENLNKLKLKGIHLSDESFRYYPAGELASQVLGFVGWKDNNLGGRYGIENFFNSELSGQEGKLFQNKDNSGLWVPTGAKEITPARNGDSLILTIDHIIQYETEKILRSAISKFEAEKGSIIVMETATGRILAMASFPNFNPNDYGNSAMEGFRNSALSDPYECGSVFKTITLAAAIDNGKINSQTVYNDTGKVVEGGYFVMNSDLKSNGKQTMTQVLEKSLNTGAVYAQKLLGNKNFSDYVKRFGFGALTQIDLPGESAGNISNLDNPRININYLTASFGQGISVTPIQLISAYNAIANGGMLMKPQMVEKIIRNDGHEDEVAPQEVRRVISEQAAAEVTRMLRSVVVNGHGKQADVPGYLVGGKTGTAQVASLKEKGYEEGKNIGSFAGFAPADNSEFTLLVRIDNPKGVVWAESSAAPAFGELMKFLLDYKNIKPTENYTQADLNRFNQTHVLGENFIKIEEEKQSNEKESQR